MKIEENENSNLVMFGVQLALANSVGFATSSVLGDRSKYLIPLILHNQQQGKETKDLEQSAFTKFKAILQEKEEGILRFNLVRKHKHFDFRIYYNQLPTYSTELMLFPIGGKAVIDQVVNGAAGRVTNLEDLGYYVFDVEWEESDTYQDYLDNLESYATFLTDILDMLSEYNITYNPGSSFFEGTYKDKCDDNDEDENPSNTETVTQEPPTTQETGSDVQQEPLPTIVKFTNTTNDKVLTEEETIFKVGDNVLDIIKELATNENTSEKFKSMILSDEYKFSYWSIVNEDGSETKINKGTVVESETITLKAHWKNK